MKYWSSFISLIALGALWTAACGSDSEGGGGSGTGGASTGGSGGASGGASGGSVSGGGGGSTGASGGTGGSAGDASTCGPTALPSAWAPKPYGPAKVQLDSCTTPMIDEYFSSCADKNEPPCEKFGASSDSAKAKCEQCLWSKLGDPGWSVLLTYSETYSIVNGYGCIELLGGENAAECAALLSASGQCVEEVCRPCYKNNTVDQKCGGAAGQGVCSSYAKAATGVCQSFTSSYCVKGDLASAKKLAAAFCGASASDAGSDAGADASQD
ncbi:MAG: hypothetical protein IPI67_39355 [Myxococcales bacterium]|nr:hypothetical protein [Myxococcales bacterium]